MRRFLVLAVTALVAVGLYAASAGGTQQAVTPGQFAALSKKVAALQKQVTSLKADFACLTALGVAGFSDQQNFGYVYKKSDGSFIITSALDVTAQGQTPEHQLAQIDPSCVSALRFARASAPAAHRSR